MSNRIKYAEKTGSVEKNMSYKEQFDDDLERTELLIDIFSLAAFLKSLFQRWLWRIGSSNT